MRAKPEDWRSALRAASPPGGEEPKKSATRGEPRFKDSALGGGREELSAGENGGILRSGTVMMMAYALARRKRCCGAASLHPQICCPDAYK